MNRKQTKDQIIKLTEDYIKAVHAYMLCPTAPQHKRIADIEEDIDLLRVSLKKTSIVSSLHDSNEVRPQGTLIQ